MTILIIEKRLSLAFNEMEKAMSKVCRRPTAELSEDDKAIIELMGTIERRDEFIIDLLVEREAMLLKIGRLEILVGEQDFQSADILDFPATGTRH